jgi:hypothetical protein
VRIPICNVLCIIGIDICLESFQYLLSRFADGKAGNACEVLDGKIASDYEVWKDTTGNAGT